MKRTFYQDRLGTNIGKALKKEWRFVQGVDPAGPDAQTGKHYPCLDPKIFNPTDLNCDDWMRAAKALGTKEICLTAQHEVRRKTPPFAPFKCKNEHFTKTGSGQT